MSKDEHPRVGAEREVEARDWNETLFKSFQKHDFRSMTINTYLRTSFHLQARLGR